MATLSMQPWTLSPVIRLRWLGWETDTYRMNNYGWEWLIEQNEYDSTFIIFAKHERDGLKAISDPISLRFMQARCRQQNVFEKIGPIEVRIAKNIEAEKRVVLQPVSMRPMTVNEGAVIEQMIELVDIDNYFVTEKWMRNTISEERRRKITLKPETMQRKLDIPNGY